MSRSPELYKYVTDRPINEKPSDKASCPFASTHHKHNIVIVESRRTLLGGGDGSIDNDPNHNWIYYECRTCERTFCREYKSGKVWYTHRGALIRGFPNCFETYFYHCAKCHHVTGKREIRYLDGITSTNGTMSWKYNETTKENVPQFREFYICSNCKFEAELLEE